MQDSIINVLDFVLSPPKIGARARDDLEDYYHGYFRFYSAACHNDVSHRFVSSSSLMCVYTFFLAVLPTQLHDVDLSILPDNDLHCLAEQLAMSAGQLYIALSSVEHLQLTERMKYKLEVESRIDELVSE